MKTTSLVARIKRLEAQRGRDFSLIEVIVNSIYGLTPEERASALAASLADARKRWPRGVTLGQLIAASYHAEPGSAS